MMHRTIIACWMFFSPQTMWADSFVIESELPRQWPAEVMEMAEPKGSPPSWAPQGTVARVREFLAAEKSDAEKRAVLAWWLQDHPSADHFQTMVQLCVRGQKWDEAFYWLQRWARVEGLDLDEWESSEGAESLRNQKRWPEMRRYLQWCEKVWQQSDYSRVCVTLPSGYDDKERLRWVIGLHGYGSQPEDFIGDDFQRLSDAQRLAIVGVSGRRALGRNSMMWTEDFAKDCAHVDQALKLVKRRAKLKSEGGIVVGFSQGGQLAADLAQAWSTRVSICVSMSPGSRYPSELRQRLFKNGDSLAHQRYFFSWISGEGLGPKQRIDDWWGLLRERGARCHMHVFSGKSHRWPPRYEDYFAVVWQME